MAGSTAIAQPLLRATALVVVLLVTPAAVGWFAAGGEGAVGAMIGAVFGLLITVRAGWRRALVTVPAIIGAAALGAATAGTWWWVAIIAALGAAAGWAARYGWITPVAIIGVVFSVESPADGMGDLLTRAAFAGASALLAILVLRRIGVPDDIPGYVIDSAVAMVAVGVFAVVAGLAAWLAVVSGWTFGYWLPMTVFVLAVPIPGFRMSHRARERVIGTFAGVVVGGLLVGLDPPIGWWVVIIFLGVLGSVAIPQPLWLNAALGTLSLLLVVGQSVAPETAGAERLVATVLGAALVLAGAGTVTWWARAHPPSLGEAELAAELVAPHAAE